MTRVTKTELILYFLRSTSAQATSFKVVYFQKTQSSTSLPDVKAWPRITVSRDSPSSHLLSSGMSTPFC